MPGEDEPLHAFITASTHESVKKAVQKIEEVIRQGIEVPENQNNLRKMQLRELALLNGTLRENDGPRCTNCGSSAHRSWQCPDKPNVTNNVVCNNCGARGHISKDCKEKKQVDNSDPSKIDEEYMLLMAELGENTPSQSASMSQSDSWIKNRSGSGNFSRRALPESNTSSYNSQPLAVQSTYPTAAVPVQTWPQAALGAIPPPPPPTTVALTPTTYPVPGQTSWASVYSSYNYYNNMTNPQIMANNMVIPSPPPPPPPVEYPNVGQSTTQPYASDTPPPPPSYS